MIKAKASSTDKTVAALLRGKEVTEEVRGGGVFTARCIGPDGAVKWEVSKPNLVVNQGLQDLNNSTETNSNHLRTWVHYHS